MLENYDKYSKSTVYYREITVFGKITNKPSLFIPIFIDNEIPFIFV
jgi:hypothetical protein